MNHFVENVILPRIKFCTEMNRFIIKKSDKPV